MVLKICTGLISTEKSNRKEEALEKQLLELKQQVTLPARFQPEQRDQKPSSSLEEMKQKQINEELVAKVRSLENLTRELEMEASDAQQRSAVLEKELEVKVRG